MRQTSWGGMTFGVNVASPPAPLYTFWNLLIPDMQALGLNTLRNQCDWSLIETSQGVYDWSYYDDVVSHANAAGLKLCLTIRGAPSWALTTVSQQATNEPFFLMDATLAAGFATIMATRYNGLNGHGYVDYIGFNEDFNIHNCSTVVNTSLNQSVTNGQSYTTLAVAATSVDLPAGTTCVFGSQSGAGQRFLISVFAPKGSTSLTITNTSGGTFVASANQSSGTRISILYFGLKSSAYVLYDGTGGVKSNQKPQPARDPQFFLPVFQAVSSAIKAVHPNCKVGTASLWWLQPGHAGLFPTSVSNVAAFVTYLLQNGASPDWIELHYYSNKIDPSIGNNQTISFAAALSDIAGVLQSFGSTAKIWVTEFGWQTLSVNTTSSTPIPAPGEYTVTPVSMANIKIGSNLLIDTGGAQETVVVLSKTGSTFTADFANAHSGTYTIQIVVDCDVPTQNSRYLSVLNSARNSGVVEKLFFFTLDYQTTKFSTSSLVQYGYSTPGQYGYLPAFYSWQGFAAVFPTLDPTQPAQTQASLVSGSAAASLLSGSGSANLIGGAGIATLSNGSGQTTIQSGAATATLTWEEE